MQNTNEQREYTWVQYVSLMCYICILNIQALIEPTQMLHTLGLDSKYS